LSAFTTGCFKMKTMQMINRLLFVLALLSVDLPAIGQTYYAALPNAKVQFFDSAGKPVAYGRLYTYEAGTSMPQPTHTDSTRTTPNANPVILDSAGQADVWLSLTSPYRLVLKTSEEVTVWTIDSVRDWNVKPQQNLVPHVLTNQMRMADEFSGANAGARINAAIKDLPSSGGYVNAIALEGVQVWSNDFFSGVTKPITLELGTGTTTISTNMIVPSNVTLRFRQGTILSIGSGMTLTIKGGMEAPIAQIFSGNGTILFSGSTRIDRVYPQWWGAVGDGVANDQRAIQAAINAVQARGGGTVRLPVVGTRYLVSGELLVSTDEVYIECESRQVTIRAGTPNQTIIHWAASYGGVRNCTLDGNDLTGVSGLRVSPQDEAQSTLRAVTSFNSFGDLTVRNTAEAIVLRTGPTIIGIQSDASYNSFESIRVADSLRCVWLTNHQSVPSASPDSNQFYSLLCYSTSTRSNTGIQIDAGSTNTFYGCSTIGMEHGTNPNSTPTAIYIAGRAAISGSDNNANMFYGQRSEFDTRVLNITSPGGNYNAFIGTSGFATAKTLDNGTSTVLLNPPDQDKGVWYSYTDADAIANIGVPTYPVRLRPGSMLDLRNNTALRGETNVGGSFRNLVGIDSSNNLRLDQNNSAGAVKPVATGYILGDGPQREIRQALQYQGDRPKPSCEWDLTDNYDSGLWLVHMANEELHMKQTILVLTARQTTGGADSTTATIVGQTGDHPFTVSVVSSKSIRLSSSGPGFYCSVTAVSEGRHMQ